MDATDALTYLAMMNKVVMPLPLPLPASPYLYPLALFLLILGKRVTDGPTDTPSYRVVTKI